jgi:uncharacterized damage-inducible protein DinB
MFTPEALLEAHRRTHLGTTRLLEHCRQLSAEEFQRELPGFGYPSIQLQLHHILSAEDYWLTVLGRQPLAEEEFPQDYPTVDSLLAFQQQVLGRMAEYLAGMDSAALARPTPLTVWGGDTVELLPEMVVMRLVTHPFQHRGQVLAMCRQLGYPAPPTAGFDFPIRPV